MHGRLLAEPAQSISKSCHLPTGVGEQEKERILPVNERDDTQSQTSDQSLEQLASRILVYSPRAALQQLAADYMRQRLRWQPGALFRYGYLGLRACEQEIYLGGLTALLSDNQSGSCPIWGAIAN